MVPNNQGLFLFYTTYNFHTVLLFFIPFGKSSIYAPIFYFCDSIFMTQFSQLLFMTSFPVTTTSGDCTTDGQTVSHPGVLSLAFQPSSTAWLTPSSYHTTQYQLRLVPSYLLTPPLALQLLQRPLPPQPPPPARPPGTIPSFITPSSHTIIPPVWEHVIVVLMKIPHLLLRDRT